MNIPLLNRPARAGGIALLGVALIATAIGTASALSGDNDGDDTATPPPGGTTTTTATTGPGSPSTTRTTGADGTTTSPTTSESKEDGEGDGTPGPTSGPNGGPSSGVWPGAGGSEDSEDIAAVKSVQLRVYNNSTIKSLAAEAARDFRANGWTVSATGNYSKGTIPTSTAYYRPGTDEQAAAELLASEFGLRVEPRFEGIQKSSPGVIVIVTRDYGQNFGGKGSK